MDIQCPYCGMCTLELQPGPSEILFDSSLDLDDLNEIEWRAYQCKTCTIVTILDEKEVKKLYKEI